MKVDMEIGVDTTTSNRRDQEADRKIEIIRGHIKTTKTEETTTEIIIDTKGATIIMGNTIKEDTELFYVIHLLDFFYLILKN